MITTKLKITCALAGVCATLAVPKVGYSYSAASKTVDGGGSVVNRLFTDSGFTTVAPTNSLMWFVYDSTGNGVPTAPLNGSAGQMFGADDIFLFQDVVDGTVLGNGAGRYTQTFNSARNSDISASVGNTGKIVVYLWNVPANPIVAPGSFASTSRFTPNQGNTIGTFSLNSLGDPGFGVQNWNITGNINGSQFIVGVPEPSTYALMGIGLIGLIARRFKK